MVIVFSPLSPCLGEDTTLQQFRLGDCKSCYIASVTHLFRNETSELPIIHLGIANSVFFLYPGPAFYISTSIRFCKSYILALQYFFFVSYKIASYGV
jgi:hypothetical protein